MIGQEGLAKRWARPSSTECGLWAWVCPVPFPASPTPRLHFIYSVLALVTEWAWTGPKDVCRASPYPIYTPPLTPSVCSLPPPAWGQNNLLLHNGSPSGCLPATPYTLTETAIPHPVLNKCVCQGVFARFLRVGSLKGWGVGVCFELKSNRGDRQRTQFL